MGRGCEGVEGASRGRTQSLIQPLHKHGMEKKDGDDDDEDNNLFTFIY